MLITSKACESCFCVGAVGLTEESTELLRWMICGPELSHCVNEFEASLTCNNGDEREEKIQDANSKHHKQNKSRQNQFGCQVLNLIKVISNMGMSCSLFLVKLSAFRPETLLERESNTGVYL